MLIVFRWWYFVGIAGLVLAVKGGIELNLASKVADEPQVVQLADLENGVAPDQPFVKIETHYAAFDRAVYFERKGRITELVYPIVSEQHPWSLQCGELIDKYGDPAKVPVGEVPRLEPLVLVTTSRFKRTSEVPEAGDQPAAMGILERYGELSSDTRELVDMLSPLRRDRVFVIELGRTPMSGLVALVMLLGGLSLIGWAISLFFGKRRETGPFDLAPNDGSGSDQGEGAAVDNPDAAWPAPPAR